MKKKRQQILLNSIADIKKKSESVVISRPLAAACSQLLPIKRQDRSLGSARPSKSPFISASVEGGI